MSLTTLVRALAADAHELDAWRSRYGPRFDAVWAKGLLSDRIEVAARCLPRAAVVSVLLDVFEQMFDRPTTVAAVFTDEGCRRAFEEHRAGELAPAAHEALAAMQTAMHEKPASFASAAVAAQRTLFQAGGFTSNLRCWTVLGAPLRERVRAALGWSLPECDGPPDWATTPIGAPDEQSLRQLFTRVRRQLDALVPALAALGYKVRPKRRGAVEPALDRLGIRVGGLPLALELFYREVGPISLVAAAPAEWGAGADEQIDALVIEAPSRILNRLGPEPHPASLPLFPDAVLKAGSAGVGDVHVELVPMTIDPPLTFEGEPLLLDGAALTFVGYLKRALGCAGLLGACHLSDPAIARRLYAIAHTLEPL